MSLVAHLSQRERSHVYHALSGETRLAIVEELRAGERCDAAQSRLSFHLKVLRDAGLVTDREEGRWWSYTTLVPDRFETAAEALRSMAKPGARRASKLHQLARTRPSPKESHAVAQEAAGKCCG